jgi:hypothetical protein
VNAYYPFRRTQTANLHAGFQVSRRFRQTLSSIGCESEYFQKHNLIAINIPPEASLKAVQDYLAAVAARGWIDYEDPILRQR